MGNQNDKTRRGQEGKEIFFGLRERKDGRNNQRVTYLDQVDDVNDNGCYLILIRLVLVLYVLGLVQESSEFGSTLSSRKLKEILDHLNEAEDRSARWFTILEYFEFALVKPDQKTEYFLLKDERCYVTTKRKFRETEWMYYSVERMINSNYKFNFNSDDKRKGFVSFNDDQLERLCEQASTMMRYYGKRYCLEWTTEMRRLAQEHEIMLYEFDEVYEVEEEEQEETRIR